jgi:hypothetical protein
LKRHDKEFFYKYTTAETAKIILSNLTVRWSSPELFNDPFDTQLKLKMGFEFDDLPKALTDAFDKLIFSEQETNLDSNALGYQIINKLRPFRNKLPRKKIKELSESLIKDGAEEATKFILERQIGWNQYLLTFKVFCVAEEYDNLLMWSHYAQNHSGVVLKFKCLPEQDTALCAATPINYQKDISTFGSLDEWVNHVTGLKRIDMEQKSKEFIYTKSAHWSYEKEWRVYTYREELNNQEYVDFEVLSEEIDGLILGCRIDDGNKEDIFNLLKKNNLNHVEVLQAKKSEDKFSLDFKML